VLSEKGGPGELPRVGKPRGSPAPAPARPCLGRRNTYSSVLSCPADLGRYPQCRAVVVPLLFPLKPYAAARLGHGATACRVTVGNPALSGCGDHVYNVAPCRYGVKSEGDKETTEMGWVYRVS